MFPLCPRVWLACGLLCACVFAAQAAEGKPAKKAPKPPKPEIVERTLKLELRVPDGAWTLHIDEVWQVRNELWVFAHVRRPDDGLGVQMICTASDEVVAKVPDLPVTRTLVIGKTWKWPNNEPVEWVDDIAAMHRERRDGERVWRR